MEDPEEDPGVTLVGCCVTAEEPKCFPTDPAYSGQYANWQAMGEPDCWCAPYHCDGDAAVNDSGPLFYYRVYNADLGLIVDNWARKIDDWDPSDPLGQIDPNNLNPCADVDHKDSGPLFYYVVYNGDLERVVAHWTAKDYSEPYDPNKMLTGRCPLNDVDNDNWTDQTPEP
jgi:hypothetical protein